MGGPKGRPLGVYKVGESDEAVYKLELRINRRGGEGRGGERMSRFFSVLYARAEVANSRAVFCVGVGPTHRTVNL